MEIKNTTYAGFTISYGSDIDFPILIDEIFEQQIYKFETQNKAPLIIDCGSNIGISILYFKQQYPASKIIAFEPDPDNYELLQENIAQNKLTGVTTYNLALSDYTGNTDLFFESDKSSTLGNTTTNTWGDRPGFEKITVKADKLSNYIGNEKIDYLKLDVEGAEKKVFSDVENNLTNIHQLGFEFHHTVSPDNTEDYDKIISLLNSSWYTLNIKHINMDFMPAKYKPWLDAYQPSLSVINASRI